MLFINSMRLFHAQVGEMLSLMCARNNSYRYDLMDSLDCKVRELHSNMNYTNLIQETLGVTIYVM